MSKKNTKKEVLSSSAGDEPCLCGHPRRSHLGEGGDLCLACYVESIEMKGKKAIYLSFRHHFRLDNLAYIEKLHDQKQLDKFRKGMEKFKRES